MTPPPPALGRCGDCGAAVPRSRLLIEYETGGDGTAAYAECPACGRVTRPR